MPATTRRVAPEAGARVALVAVDGLADRATADAVTRQLKALPGILRVVLDLAPGAGSPMLVEYRPPASREAITKAVKTLGHHVQAAARATHH